VCNCAKDFLKNLSCVMQSFCAKCSSISVGATFSAVQGRRAFVLSFVCFNVASEVTEIGRISVVMHVSD